MSADTVEKAGHALVLNLPYMCALPEAAHPKLTAGGITAAQSWLKALETANNEHA